ncbi:MAG: hypothetical protein BEN19_02650 [Epulopiscium sp. Nuni2H_MBin003]|nr:MAG: hypothetical protein BEN19_02650 [Epulopiscium sp. Nuni2H_MBin003]
MITQQQLETTLIIIFALITIISCIAIIMKVDVIKDFEHSEVVTFYPKEIKTYTSPQSTSIDNINDVSYQLLYTSESGKYTFEQNTTKISANSTLEKNKAITKLVLIAFDGTYICVDDNYTSALQYLQVHKKESVLFAIFTSFAVGKFMCNVVTSNVSF